VLENAYRKLQQFDESRPLKPWLFRIAHNRCINFLWHKGVRGQAEAAAAVPDAVPPVEPSTLGIGKAVEHLVASLPPKDVLLVIRVNVTG
jgi:RNA polymerase sigma-70 factor, ECF subfamily